MHIRVVLPLGQSRLLIALGFDWQRTMWLFINVTLYSHKSCFWAKVCTNANFPNFFASTLYSPSVPFLSPVSGTSRYMQVLGQLGSSTLSCRNISLWPRPCRDPEPQLSVKSCDFMVSKLNRVLIQILQILSMNITKRIRTKSQPGQNPNLHWKSAWVYADTAVILLIHRPDCSHCNGHGTVIWEIVSPADPFGGRRCLLPELSNATTLKTPTWAVFAISFFFFFLNTSAAIHHF